MSARDHHVSAEVAKKLFWRLLVREPAFTWFLLICTLGIPFILLGLLGLYNAAYILLVPASEVGNDASIENTALIVFLLLPIVTAWIVWRGVKRKQRLLQYGKRRRARIIGRQSGASFAPDSMRYAFKHQGKIYRGMLRRDVGSKELPVHCRPGKTVQLLYDPENPYVHAWAEPLDYLTGDPGPAFIRDKLFWPLLKRNHYFLWFVGLLSFFFMLGMMVIMPVLAPKAMRAYLEFDGVPMTMVYFTFAFLGAIGTYHTFAYNTRQKIRLYEQGNATQARVEPMSEYLSYQFEVNGKTYHGVHKEAFWKKLGGAPVSMRQTLEASVKVYYDPEDPRRNTLAQPIDELVDQLKKRP